jgi:ribosomal protein L21E
MKLKKYPISGRMILKSFNVGDKVRIKPLGSVEFYTPYEGDIGIIKAIRAEAQFGYVVEVGPWKEMMSYSEAELEHTDFFAEVDFETV